MYQVKHYFRFEHKIHFEPFKFQIACVWIAPAIFLLPTLVSSWGQFGLECSSRGCTIIDDKEARNPKNVLNGVGMVLPIAILVVADVSIIWKVRVGVIINFTFDRLEL